MKVETSVWLNMIGFAYLVVKGLFEADARRQTARDLRVRLEVEAEALKIHTTQQTQRLQQAVEENNQLTREGTSAAQDAYKEANSVNNKIASIGLKVADGLPLTE